MRPIPIECFRRGEPARCGNPTGDNWLTEPQIGALLHTAGSTATLCRRATTRLLMLGLFAGLRIGELHRLRWRDIARTG